jgi:diguanylate cyclase (GGDEF)-like protein
VPIRLLVIDDSPHDADLSLMTLRRSGAVIEAVIAADEAELRSILLTFVPDVILCDFSLPGLDGLGAQRIVREFHVDVPLIFVSGTISEDRAVAALRSGAVDYVLKSNLQRLPSAVQHAVREARERTRLKGSLEDSEERARRHAERLEALWRIVNDPQLRDKELWRALLAQAAASIRPGVGSRATLWRVDGDVVVLEAVVETENASLPRHDVSTGRTVPLAKSIIAHFIGSGESTQSWDDLQDIPAATTYFDTAHIRALVITKFIAGGTTWVLAFASGHPATHGLGRQEHAFVEVLASFFANHVQQRWQFDRIVYQQSHDVLTGLLNRSQFRSQALEATRKSRAFAVVLVDVNAFREINESYGHMIGDALLVEVASALQGCAREGDAVGRIGGDVFAIYIADPSSNEELIARVQAIADVFDRPFSTGDREGKEFVSRSASIGAAISPADGVGFATIFSHADAALAAAKARGHGSILLYTPGMEGDALRRAELRNELGIAVAENQFTLYYQPHVDLMTGAVTGCEALIRWNHPVRGLVMPGQFIPFAEQIGFIGQIDAWVMQNAFEVARVVGAKHPDFRLYFNLSGRQVGDASIVHAFVEAARNGVELRRIGVEITETDAMRDVVATRRVCRALRRLNVRIAIDDFGTGYSSLSSLKLLPVDIVKIDRSFIAGIQNDPHDGAIAETINRHRRSLRLRIAGRGCRGIGRSGVVASPRMPLRPRLCHRAPAPARGVPRLARDVDAERAARERARLHRRRLSARSSVQAMGIVPASMPAMKAA